MGPLGSLLRLVDTRHIPAARGGIPRDSRLNANVSEMSTCGLLFVSFFFLFFSVYSFSLWGWGMGEWGAVAALVLLAESPWNREYKQAGFLSGRAVRSQ